jgi:large subunit ribosomal protein L21
MYAIVQVGGRQYRAAPGDRLVVDRLDVEPGARFQLADVRMLVAEDGDSAETQIGRPRLEEVSVAARAVGHFRGPKILVFKYKPKKRYRRHQGFRAELTELRIEERPAPRQTVARSAKAVAPQSAEEVEAAATKEPEAGRRADGSVRATAKETGPKRRKAAARPVDTGPVAVKTETDAERPRSARARSAAKPADMKKPASRTRSKPKEAQEQADGS